MVSVVDYGPRGPRPGRGTVCCGLEQVTFTHCLVLVKPRKPWTDNCDEAGDYVVPNVLSPRDLVSRTDNMDETLLSSFDPCLSCSHEETMGPYSYTMHNKFSNF